MVMQLQGITDIAAFLTDEALSANKLWPISLPDGNITWPAWTCGLLKRRGYKMRRQKKGFYLEVNLYPQG